MCYNNLLNFEGKIKMDPKKNKFSFYGLVEIKIVSFFLL